MEVDQDIEQGLRDLHQFAASYRGWRIDASGWARRRVETPFGPFELGAAAAGKGHSGKWVAVVKNGAGDLVAEWYEPRDHVIDDLIGGERALLLLNDIAACRADTTAARDVAVKLKPRQIGFLAQALDIRMAGSHAGILEAVIYRITGGRIRVDQWRLR